MLMARKLLEECERKYFHSTTAKLLYLVKRARPDISCAVHQCARHCANPKIQHTAAVKRIGRYLLGTKDKGLIMKPNQEGMECWVDASHASEWNNKTASSDPNTARSRMVLFIMENPNVKVNP